MILPPSDAAEKGPLRRGLDEPYLGACCLADAFLAATLALMMSLAVGQEVGWNIPAGDDFASWRMAALAFLSLAYALEAGEIIRVGLLWSDCGWARAGSWRSFARCSSEPPSSRPPCRDLHFLPDLPKGPRP